MEISIILSVLGAGLASVLSSSAIFKLIRQFKEEKKLTKNINKQKINYLDQNLQELKKISDSETLIREAKLNELKNEIRKIFLEISKNENDWKEINEGLNQSSSKGQENYIEKIINNTKKNESSSRKASTNNESFNKDNHHV